MISRITGKLVHMGDESINLAVESLEYQVLVPHFVFRQLQSKRNEKVGLYTIQYLDGNPAQGRLIPRLIGFMTEVEREFFELFCSVDGVGARKALRAMVRPVKDVAVMVEEQDSKGLSTLPGIGAATAERIIAKLRRKMPKFALLVDERDPKTLASVEPDVKRDTYEALISLGHSESEARKLIDDVLASGKKLKDTDAMLRAIYDQKNA